MFGRSSSRSQPGFAKEQRSRDAPVSRLQEFGLSNLSSDSRSLRSLASFRKKQPTQQQAPQSPVSHRGADWDTHSTTSYPEKSESPAHFSTPLAARPSPLVLSTLGDPSGTEPLVLGAHVAASCFTYP